MMGAPVVVLRIGAIWIDSMPRRISRGKQVDKKNLSISHAIAIGRYRAGALDSNPGNIVFLASMEDTMKTWTKPAVREQEVGLEVTSYLPAEIDLI
jgi:coenzyme PQQ precursor peptide PqqA